MENFKARFKRLLKEDNITVKEVAEKLSVNPDTVKNYITKASTPKMEILMNMCEEFPHWSPSYLIAGQGEPLVRGNGTDSPQEPIIPSLYDSLSQWIGYKQELELDLDRMPIATHHGLVGTALNKIEELLRESENLIEAIC